jgi:hypothetical protein
MTRSTPTAPPLQADLVAVLAGSLPRSVVDSAVLECLVPSLHLQGCMGNVHKARARAAVLGALSRGLAVRLGNGRIGEVVFDQDEMTDSLLDECCKSP